MEIGVVGYVAPKERLPLFRRIPLCSASPWQLWLMDYIESVCFSFGFASLQRHVNDERNERNTHVVNNGIEMSMIKMKEMERQKQSTIEEWGSENGRNWFQCW